MRKVLCLVQFMSLITNCNSANILCGEQDCEMTAIQCYILPPQLSCPGWQIKFYFQFPELIMVNGVQ